MRVNIAMGFFLPVPPVAGGATEKVWFRLGREFVGAGHAVTLLSRRWPGFPAREQIDGIQMIRVPGFNHTRHLAFNLLLDGLWGLRLLRQLPAADLTVCNNVSLPVHLPWLRRRAGRVVVVLGRMPKGQIRFYRRVARLVATSDAVAARVAQECPALQERTRVIPNPIDWALHACSAAQRDGPVTIGFVGRLHPEKGLELLLDAAIRLAGEPGLPPWRVLIRGPSDVHQGGGGEAYVRQLQDRYAPRLGSRLAWAPAVFDTAKLARCYGELDIFCYPSLAAQGEGLSVAPLEAMAAGAVPVLSRLDCYRDVLREGANGFSFDHDGPAPAAGLASVLVPLIGDAALRRTVAARAQADVRRFDYSVVAHDLLEDFNRLTKTEMKS
jgi:glycosyltransferase involved in cell wall biosynthesis